MESRMNEGCVQVPDKPRVSIVTISYNQGRYLEQAITSVLSQTYDNIEYILVDAGSTDNSLSIIDRYRDRIATVICEPDNGPADGLNKGFRNATGDIFGYINADDFYLSDAVEKAVAFFGKHRSADIMSGHCYIVNEMTGKVSLGISDRFDPLKASLETCFLMQPSTFFSYTVFHAAGGFNIDNHTCWDIELIIDACLAGKQVAVNNEILSVFRMHGDSISGSNSMYNQYKLDKNRLFTKIAGRELRPGDRYLRLLYHIQRIPHRIGLIPFCLKNRFSSERLQWVL